MTSAPPTVLLVGAGPGAPDLLTLDAERALAAARLVVADRALAPLLATLVAGPRVVWVDDDQPAGGAILSALALHPADRVVRLYRGDPWFHPGGDADRAALRGAGAAWTSLPGVVPEIAALAEAGIPVQLRTSSVTTTFVVDGPTAELELPADPAHALVVRTADLAATVRRLADPVAAADYPERAARAAAVVGDHGIGAGRSGPTVVRTTVGALATAAAGLTGAGVVVVGLVAVLDTRSGAPGRRVEP
ncbi:hypothetical protein BH10ACT1_BH10ACT1_43320 [soil metagenome]